MVAICKPSASKRKGPRAIRPKDFPREYKIWGTMLQRCNNSRCREYKHYGARGIKVCRRWQGRNGFANFLSDVGPRPFAKASIHRINNNRGYRPGNVTWVDPPTQHRHMRSNRILRFAGQRRIMTDWAVVQGMKPVTLGARLKRGWKVEDALTRPVEPRRPYAEWKHRLSQ